MRGAKKTQNTSYEKAFLGPLSRYVVITTLSEAIQACSDNSWIAALPLVVRNDDVYFVSSASFFDNSWIATASAMPHHDGWGRGLKVTCSFYPDLVMELKIGKV